LASVIAFFEARSGRLRGFRWKDWADYKSCLPSQMPAATDQLIGQGDGVATAFQLTKTYTSGLQSYVRDITKPVTGTVLVAVGGVPQSTGWLVDTVSGIVTFTVAPANGASVTAGFEFDVPVRFDSDLMDVNLDIERLGSIASIPLVEIRL
jgi:uncharacterized protein (TIGR02217 family)